MNQDMNQEKILQGILVTIKALPLGSACKAAKLYTQLFENLQIPLNTNVLCEQIWYCYDPGRLDNEMLDTIKYWISNS